MMELQLISSLIDKLHGLSRSYNEKADKEGVAGTAAATIALAASVAAAATGTAGLSVGAAPVAGAILALGGVAAWIKFVRKLSDVKASEVLERAAQSLAMQVTQPIYDVDALRRRLDDLISELESAKVTDSELKEVAEEVESSLKELSTKDAGVT